MFPWRTGTYLYNPYSPLNLINREAKEFGGSAHVTVPKDWRGADVKVIRVSDPDETDDQEE